MKKVIVCLLLALALSVLSQRQVRQALFPARQEAQQAAPQTAFERELGVQRESHMLDVTLYFRYADTGVLGASRAQIDMRREETVASSIVRGLMAGPNAAHDRLSGVFPQGTRLLGVSGEGETAFVTLSRAFLGRPDGAPSDWEDLAVWQEEAALRRRLAYQSIVLALTEGGRFQRVQLYVADSDDDVPQRIPLAYFDPSVRDPGVMLAACARDEAALLTPHRAMEMILSAWQRQDWEALYALILREETTPTLSVFEAQMRETAVSLLDCDVSQGTVSVDGQQATVVVDAQIRSEAGGDAQIVRESVPLARDADNWAIRLSALTALMIRD